MRLRIVLCEPDKKTYFALAEALRHCGYRIGSWKADRTDSAPNIVLINVSTANRHWRTQLRSLRRRYPYPQVPILGYTATALRTKRPRALEAGCDNVITLAALRNHPLWQITLLARPQRLGPRRSKLPAGVAEGISLFNHGKFHNAHDAIEAVWLKETAEVRLLYQGILQAGIAYYHIEKGHWDVALRMFVSAKTKIVHFLPVFQGINVKKLHTDLRKGERLLKKLGSKNIRRFSPQYFPQIEMR